MNTEEYLDNNHSVYILLSLSTIYCCASRSYKCVCERVTDAKLYVLRHGTWLFVGSYSNPSAKVSGRSCWSRRSTRAEARWSAWRSLWFFFFFKQKTAYEI